ncbi:MAG TPA: ABC transporter permease [Blastocatellia bacterium]|nr:ABC transporter permease [Blastocatellia bacterium]
METLWNDLQYGFRRLLKSPGFTLVAILSLAIGIGANSAIFSVANALLLRPLPYKDADRIAILWNRSPGLNIERDWFSLGQYLDVKLENQVFEQVAATIDASYNLTGQGHPERLEGAKVSSSLFSLLGAQAMLGRVFLPEEDQTGKPLTVILSHAFWQRRFGGDQNILGKTLTLNDQNYTIVGVMPATFALSKEVMPTVNSIEKAEVFLPLPLTEADRTKRGGEDYNIFAKLKPGVTVAQAQANMDAITAQMKRQYPENYPANGGLTFSVVPLLEQVVGDIRLALYVLLGAVGFVLLIACANVANLLLARAAVRQKEIAVRAAVGASRARLVRQLLTESVLLAVLGGLLGLALASYAEEGLRLFGSASIPRWQEVGVDARVLAFTFLLSMLTGILFGLVPALRASRVDLIEVLKDGMRSSAGSGHHRTRNLLVIAEVALSLVLLIGAGLLIRSYYYLQTASPGFDPNGVLSLRLSLPTTRYTTPESVYNFYKQLDEKVKQLPGIEFVGMNYSLPFSSTSAAWGPITIEGYVPKAASELIMSNERFISPDYLRAMGMPLVKGRPFNEHDIKGAQEVCLVNEALAARFWPNEDPIGKRIQRIDKGPWRTVVGIVRDARQVELEKEPPLSVYYPIDQFTIRTRFFVARTAADPHQTTLAITKVVQSLDSELPVYDVSTMEERLAHALAQRRLAMVLLSVFAVVALVLAAIGIYGVMSYWVSQRQHEIGIRMALGAAPSNIVQLVARQALLLISIGVSIGLIGAFALTRVMTSLLFGVSATDGLTFGLLALLLGGIALLASYLPARRATKVDPMIALRAE